MFSFNWAFSDCIRYLKCQLSTIVSARTYFWVHVSVGFLKFLLEMDQNIKFGGTIVYGDSSLEYLFNHLEVYKLHAKLNDALGAKSGLLLDDWTRTRFMFAWSRDWTILLASEKTFSTFHFPPWRLLTQYVLHRANFWTCR